MSNAKVERHKYEKYNRKKIELKRKIKNVVVGISVTLIIVAMLGVMGYQIYDEYIKYDTIAKIDLSAMVEAMGKVESASTEEEKDTESATVETDKESDEEDVEVDNGKSEEQSKDVGKSDKK